MPNRRLLVLFAHPALQRSRVNRRLVREAQSMDGVTFHDLYEEYPRLDIDVRREQELMTAHDVIVFQHPMYWYSTPSILKEWQDLVLEHGWAYGRGGTALQGKRWIEAVTTGGPEAAYCAQGRNAFTVRQLLVPLERTALLCRMHFLPPFVVHGAHGMTDDDIEASAREYRTVLTALREDRVDEEAAAPLERINRDLSLTLRTAVEP